MIAGGNNSVLLSLIEAVINLIVYRDQQHSVSFVIELEPVRRVEECAVNFFKICYTNIHK
jgi:uncharacterized protein (UPF0262 family)